MNIKSLLLDYKLCLLPAFSSPVQTLDFYAKSQSLYAEVSLLFSKWTGFYSNFPIWFCTRGRRPIWSLWVRVMLYARRALLCYEDFLTTTSWDILITLFSSITNHMYYVHALAQWYLVLTFTAHQGCHTHKKRIMY